MKNQPACSKGVSVLDASMVDEWALPLVGVTASRTTEANPRCEVRGVIVVNGKSKRIHVKTFLQPVYGPSFWQRGQKLAHFVKETSCTNHAALAALSSLA